MCLREVQAYAFVIGDTVKQLLLAHHGAEVKVVDLTMDDVAEAISDAAAIQWDNTNLMPDMPAVHTADWSKAIPWSA